MRGDSGLRRRDYARQHFAFQHPHTASAHWHPAHMREDKPADAPFAQTPSIRAEHGSRPRRTGKTVCSSIVT